MFMRDAKQAEVLLSQQDNFLSKEETPVRCFVCLFITFVDTVFIYKIVLLRDISTMT